MSNDAIELPARGDAQGLARLVRRMREAQKAPSRALSRLSQARARRLEAAVDDAVLRELCGPGLFEARAGDGDGEKD